MRRTVTLVTLAALAAFTGCSCETDTPIKKTTGEINVPSVFDYKLVCQGDRVVYQVPIENTGRVPLDITSVTLEGPGADSFEIVEWPEQLAAAGSENAKGSVLVAFSPATEGTLFARLVIESSDAELPRVEVSLNGEGSETGTPRVDLVLFCETESGTQLETCPGSLYFGDVAVDASAEIPVVIENMGCAQVDITDIRVVNDQDPGPYTVTAPETPFTVTSAVRQTIVPTFAPTSADVFTGKVQFDWSDPNGAAGQETGSGMVSLMGNAVELHLVVDPRAFTFAEAAVGQPETHTFTIRNLGGIVPTIEAVTLQTDNPEFTITAPDLPVEVGAVGQPDDTLEFQVTYEPVDAGRDENAIVIRTNLGALDPVRLYGGAIPVIELSPPDTVDFGYVETGASATQDVSVKNVGKAVLTIQEIRFNLEETGEGVFFIDDNPTDAGPVALEVGESLTFTVRFQDDPTIGSNAGQGQSESGSLEIVSDDPNTPVATLLMITDTERNLPPLVVDLRTFVEGTECTAPPCELMEGTLVSFDSSGTFDPDGDIVRYTWEIVSRPDVTASTAELTYPGSAEGDAAELIPDWPGTWRVKVTARDQFATGGSSTVTLTVSPDDNP